MRVNRISHSRTLMKKQPLSIMPVFTALVVVAVLAPLLVRGQLKVDSFGANGVLSWSDPGGGGTNYAVQWASTVDGQWLNWQDAVSNLTGLGATGTASVPMFYRVVTPDPTYKPVSTYSYLKSLPTMKPRQPLESNEMRITFMGSMIPLPVRLAQAEMSVFVEVGWKPDPTDPYYQGRAVDQVVFDCGAGVSANYAAASVGFRRMDKVFINHLHADHMNDLAHIYCFGPSGDRKSPLFVFGPGRSGVPNPTDPLQFYDDGTSNFCAMSRNAWRWHSESFSFQTTRYTNYVAPTKDSWGLPVEPVPVPDDAADDAYAIIPIELNWTNIGGVAYHNQETRVKVSHYPVIHARRGSVGYKLEWTPPGTDRPLTMIYSSDTKPETNSVYLACNGTNGVDVFVHEMVIPPDMWAWKQLGLDGPPSTNDWQTYQIWQAATDELKRVQNSSHTPQGAYGYLLSQINPRPRLAVATHFPVADDTVNSAFESVKGHCPDIVFGRDIVWSFDLMVLRVFPDRIEQLRVDASEFAWNPPVQLPTNGMYAPKYNTNGVGDPFAQIDLSTQISWTNENGTVNYREDGY